MPSACRGVGEAVGPTIVLLECQDRAVPVDDECPWRGTPERRPAESMQWSLLERRSLRGWGSAVGLAGAKINAIAIPRRADRGRVTLPDPPPRHVILHLPGPPTRVGDPGFLDFREVRRPTSGPWPRTIPGSVARTAAPGMPGRAAGAPAKGPAFGEPLERPRTGIPFHRVQEFGVGTSHEVEDLGAADRLKQRRAHCGATAPGSDPCRVDQALPKGLRQHPGESLNARARGGGAGIRNGARKPDYRSSARYR